MKRSDIKNSLGESLFLGVFTSLALYLMTPVFWPWFVVNSFGLFLVTVLLYHYNCRVLITYAWGVSATFMGMFAGVILDFGVPDVSILYGLCSQNNVISIAPATTIGMFLGCNFGMLMSSQSTIKVSHLLLCNAGMLAAMFLFDAFGSYIVLYNEPLALMVHLVLMVMGGHVFNVLADLFFDKNVKFKFFYYMAYKARRFFFGDSAI